MPFKNLRLEIIDVSASASDYIVAIRGLGAQSGCA